MNPEDDLEQQVSDLQSELEDAMTDLGGAETELAAVTDERDDLLNKLRILEGGLEDLWRSI